MENAVWRTGLVVLGLAVLAAGGCSKITRANWEMVAPGMTKNEVIGIMGEHTWSPSGQEQKLGGRDVNVWMYRQKKQKIDMNFYFDPDTEKLAAKEWDPWPNTESQWDKHELVGRIPSGLNVHTEMKSSK